MYAIIINITWYLSNFKKTIRKSFKKKTKVNWFYHSIFFFTHLDSKFSYCASLILACKITIINLIIQISEVLKNNDSCVAKLDSNQIERIIHVHFIFKITTCTCVEGGGGRIWYGKRSSRKQYVQTIIILILLSEKQCHLSPVFEHSQAFRLMC